jgi:nitroimidazol reductase NimA-like FMN-containing flavoprotein (pyridoxamine 5'-phosphate oxidase superfamily)
MTFPQTARTKLKRLPKRGHFDRETVYGILDEGFICHVGFAIDAQPFVIPTGYGRVGDKLYIHGSQASRMLRSLAGGINVCVTVTIVDGLVLARSAFHHSMNYRSVVVFGRATLVDDPQEKMEALVALSEHIVRGRWDDVRGPNDEEIKLTTVLCLPLEEASAKIRTGPPLDDEEDYALPIWAGVVPLKLVAGEPVKDPLLSSEIAVPDYAAHYKR